MDMSLYDDFMAAFDKAVIKAGNLNQLSEKSGILYPTLYRWKKGQQIPSLTAIEPLLPFLEWPSSHTSHTITPVQEELEKLRAERDKLRREVESLTKRLDEQKDKTIEILTKVLTERKEIASSLHEEATVPPQGGEGERKIG